MTNDDPIKVGDKVMANVLCELDWRLEELRLGVTYKVCRVWESDSFGLAIQLDGVYSSYRPEWLVKVKD